MVSKPLSCLRILAISFVFIFSFIEALLDAKSIPLPMPSLTLTIICVGATVKVLLSSGKMEVTVGTRVSYRKL